MMQFKRILSLILALVLTVGLLPPVAVRAEETDIEVFSDELVEDIFEEVPVEESTEAPTEEPTEAPTEEPTEPPTEAPTEPAEAVTEPTEAVTEPTEFIGEALEEIPTEPVPEEIFEEITSEESASGASAGGLTWKLLGDGTLILSGQGPMDNYTGEDTPWADCALPITSVVIEEGVTSVGDYAFAGCADMIALDLPGSVTSVSATALPEQELSIQYNGTLEQWDTLGLDLAVVCLQGSESAPEPEVYFIRDEEGQVLELTPEEFAQMPATFAMSRASVSITDVKWHRSYTYGTNSYVTWKGMMSWKSSASGSAHYTLTIQKKSGSSWEDVTAMGVTSEVSYTSCDYFVKIVDRMNLTSGNYRYTVRHQSSGTTATSDTYKFPGQPSKTIGTPSAPEWRVFNNYPAMVWNLPSDKSNLYGYEIELRFSSSSNGAAITVGTISSNGSWYKEQSNGFCQSDYHFTRNGPGYYYFRIRNLTSNIESAKNSGWSGLSSPYYFDGRDLTISNGALDPGAYPEFSWAEYPVDPSSTLTHDYALYSLLAYSSSKLSDGSLREADEDTRDISLLPDQLEEDGFSNLHSYYYSEQRLGGNVTRHGSGQSSYNTTNCIIAHRKINDNADGTDKVVDQVMVVFRGTFWREWYGNFDLCYPEKDADGNVIYKSNQKVHWSFKHSAEETMGFLGDYIQELAKKKLIDPNNVKITLTGHSRGGAVANLMAHYLTEIRDENRDNIPNASHFNGVDIGSVHAYTFATPNVATYGYISGCSANTNYNNIFNFCLTDDFVPNLPLESWSWGKFGRTYWSTAETSLKNSEMVMNGIKKYKGSKPDYNAKNTRGMVEAMDALAGETRDYYEKDIYIKDVDNDEKDITTRLYVYAHDGLGANRAGDGGVGVLGEPLLHTTADNNLRKLADHIVGGGVMFEKPLANAHECYSYYYGTLYAFASWKESVLTEDGYGATNYTFARAGNAASDPNAEQVAYLKEFLTTQGFTEDGVLYLTNAEKLGWDPEAISTWEGLTWDGEGNLIGLDWRTLSISGHLDLTRFPRLQVAELEYCALTKLTAAGHESLQKLDCSGNFLTELDLTGCTALYDLDCSFNQLTALDLSDCADLELLACTDNQLTKLDLSNCPHINELTCSDNYLNAYSITYYDPTVTISNDADQQQVSAQANFCETDVAALKAIYTANTGILSHWDPEDPTSWTGVQWTAVYDDETGETVYYAETVNLTGLQLTGEADFSGCVRLNSLLLSSNSFTRITIDGCDALEQLWCELNFLSDENVMALEEQVFDCVLLPQRVNAILDQGDVEALKALTQAHELDWSEDMYTVNQSLTWTADEEDVWHLTGLTLDNIGIDGTLDLSVFAHLASIRIRETEITAITIPESVTNVSLRGSTGLKTITFLGNAPTFSSDAFVGLTASVETPVGDTSWSNHFTQFYGGNVTWSYQIQAASEAKELIPGESTILTASFHPIRVTGSTVNWYIGEEDAVFATLKVKGDTATVTASSSLTEKRTVTVFASSSDGMAQTDAVEITLYPKVQKLFILHEGTDITGTTALVDVSGGLPQDYTLTCQAVPSDIQALLTTPLVTWTSKTPKIATVDQNGAVTFLAESGTARFTVDANDGSKASATVSLQLVKPPQGVTLKAPATEVLAGRNVTFTAVDQNGTSLNKNQITWSLAPEYAAFADINANGKLTAKKIPQAATVTVTGKVTDSAQVLEHDITIVPLASQVEIAGGSKLLLDRVTIGQDGAPEDNSLQLVARVYPEDAGQEVSWSVKGKAAVIDTNGLLTPVSDGTVTVTATTTDGSKKKTTATVVIGDFTDSVTITTDPQTSITYPGEPLTLEVQTVPENAQVEWKLLEGSRFVQLSSDGVLTPKAVYETQPIRVQAVSADGAVASDVLRLWVAPSSRDILVLRDFDGNIVAGSTTLLQSTISLRACILESDETQYEAVWESSDTNVAQVYSNEDGTAVVVAVDDGTAVITASVGESEELRSASTTVRVGSFLQGIAIESNTDAFSVASGKKLTLTAATFPLNSKGTVTWSLAEGDEAYASINAKGVLTAAANLAQTQTVTVIATADDGSGTTAYQDITITPLTQALDIRDEDQTVVTGTTQVFDMSGSNTLVLSADVYPETADQGIAWKSSNPRIASIDESSGIVTCYRGGTVTITASATDGSGRKATFKLTVVKQITGLYLQDQSLAGGKSLDLSKLVVIQDKDATNRKLTWSCSGDTAFATLSDSGVLKTSPVTGVKTVTVTAETTDGSGLSCSARVLIYPAVTSVSLYRDDYPVSGTLYLGVGQELRLTAENAPYGSVQHWTWSYKGTRDCIAIDPDNVIHGLNPGTVTLTVTAADGSGKKATLKIQVVRQVEELTLPTNATLAVGKSMTLSADIAPLNASIKTLRWEIIQGAELATINQKGKLTAKKLHLDRPVTVTVIAYTTDDSGITAISNVTLVPAATSVTMLDESGSVLTGSGKLFVGETYLGLSAFSEPYGAAVQEFVWTVSNAKYAGFLTEEGEIASTVTGNSAILVALAPGKTVTVTATAADGSGKKDTYRVTTAQRMEALELEEGVSVARGRSIKLKANIFPANTTNKSLIWDMEPTEGVTLSANGTLRVSSGAEADSVTVWVEARDGSGLYDDVTINIHDLTRSVKLLDSDTGYDVTGTVTMNVDDALTLSAQTLGRNGEALPTGVRWTSSDSKFVSVRNNADGTAAVTVVKPGKTVTIKASATDGSGKSASFKVRAVQEMTNLRLPEDVTVAGGKQVTIVPTFDAGATNRQLTWSIPEEDRAYASINQRGILTAKKTSEIREITVTAAYTPITASGEAQEVNCTVTITPATTSLYVTLGSNPVTGGVLTVYDDMPLTLGGTSYPEDALQTYRWKISNSRYAGFLQEDETLTASAEGSEVTIAALEPGKTVTVTAVAVDGSNRSASVRIQTARRMTGLSVEDQEIQEGRSLKLTYGFDDTNPTDSRVIWQLQYAESETQDYIDPEQAAFLFGNYLFARAVDEPVTLYLSAIPMDGGESVSFTVTILPR